MTLVIPNILTPAEIAAFREEIETLEFGDGAATAGRHARAVKANSQAAASPALDALRAKVTQALHANPVFLSAARPRQITPLILSRYREGQTYGTHVDDALMGGVRTDLSFTLFLSDPETYDGGALEIEDRLETRRIKLEAGELILYPSSSLHRVTPVTSGERLAFVGWIQSWIRSADKREILSDLDRAVETLFEAEGQTGTCETLMKTRSNLLRLWAEN